MEGFPIDKDAYKISFLYNKSLLKIIIKEKEKKGKNKFQYEPIHLTLNNNLKKYFSNLKDLINQIKQNLILIEIRKPNIISNETNIKYLNLNIILNDRKENKKIITQKINILNVEYYLTYGANYQRLNSKPFVSFLSKDNFNIEDIMELIDNEKTLNTYVVDDFRYFDKQKGVFKMIDKENIEIKEKLILEFHIEPKKDLQINNFKGPTNI